MLLLIVKGKSWWDDLFLENAWFLPEDLYFGVCSFTPQTTFTHSELLIFNTPLNFFKYSKQNQYICIFSFHDCHYEKMGSIDGII
jgi:hypothetical protein